MLNCFEYHKRYLDLAWSKYIKLTPEQPYMLYMLHSQYYAPRWSGDFRPVPDHKQSYRKTSYISRTLVGNKIVDNSDVVGASPVGAAPTTSSFST